MLAYPDDIDVFGNTVITIKKMFSKMKTKAKNEARTFGLLVNEEKSTTTEMDGTRQFDSLARLIWEG